MKITFEHQTVVASVDENDIVYIEVVPDESFSGGEMEITVQDAVDLRDVLNKLISTVRTGGSDAK